MPEPPVVDGRTAADVLEWIRDVAPDYTDEWDPESDDFGAGLVRIFSTVAADLIERVDQVPEKHRVAFFDTLGFDRRPPQPARAPLSFEVADGVGENVTVAPGTRAVAAATETRPEQTFEVAPDEGFEATPSNLVRVYTTRPADDQLFEHWAGLEAGASSELFGGEDLQTHELYLGHGDLLNVAPGATVRISVRTTAPEHLLRDRLVWEYYGEQEVDGEGVEGWYEITRQAIEREPDGSARFDLTLPTTPTETEVSGTESRWVRCRNFEEWYPTGDRDELFEVEFWSVQFVAGAETPEVSPEHLLANDVPQPVGEEGGDLLPFGGRPRRLDAFYVGSEEAFTKPGASVTLDFEAPTESGGTGVDPDPRLSWEYWDGDNWTRLPSLEDDTGALQSPGAVSFPVPTDLGSTTVAGQEAHWVRVRLVDGEYVTTTYQEEGTSGTWEAVTEGTAPRFGGVTIRYDEDDLPADAPEHRTSYNGRTYETDLPERFRPFVGLGDETQTLYLGFDGPLAGGPLSLLFSPTPREFPAGFYPRLRWEYCVEPASDRWASLDVTDRTGGLTERELVRLVFPAATRAHRRFGHELHWVRARVTGDTFGPPTTTPHPFPVSVTDVAAEQEAVVLRNAGDRTVDLSGYVLEFEYAQPVEQRRALPGGTTLAPGESLVVATGTRSTVADRAHVTLDYDRWVINDADSDTVALLTPAGKLVAKRTDVLSPAAPAPAVDLPLPPAPAGSDNAQIAAGRAAGRSRRCPDPCETELATEPPGGDPTDAPPTLSGLYPNTGWAYNVRSVEGEVVGSSDGTPDQTFAVGRPPASAPSVRVDELAALSEGARRALGGERPESVEAVTGADGETTAFWVTWTRVENFVDSGPDDRHYTLASASGCVAFGDGVRGAIPPRGTDNVRVDYRSGGGAAGNVAAGAIGDLESSLAFVDEVRNPEPSEGGADVEPTAAVLDRAPRELRDRNRAVTPADYERVATAASRRLARARCIPGMDAAGDRTPGWVTVLVVPSSDRPKPVPSVELRQRVESYLRSRAPATLAPGGGRTGEEVTGGGRPLPELVVRGPTYVTVSVEATVVAGETGSVSVVEDAVGRELDAFLHPLSGSSDGEGWDFGELPCVSDLYALLESLEGVDHAADLSLTFAAAGSEVTVAEDEETPRVARDVLVYSGAHDVTVRGGT